MVNFTTADNALKTLYLGVLAEQLNIGINPLLAKIQHTTADVWGKEIVKLAPYGMNGGVGSGTEDGILPACAGNNYAQFKLELKNFFGKIEISDKAVRASQNSAGAFVNLLNAEMDGLLKASKFNFGRMLYGDGTGLLATTVENVSVALNEITVDSVRNLMEGMIVDLYDSTGVAIEKLTGAKIIAINRATKVVSFSKSALSALAGGYVIYMQGSKNNEMTGLEALFGNTASLYGLTRANYSFLTPYSKTINSGVYGSVIQDAIDQIEEIAGGAVDFIVSSYDVRRAYIENLNANRTNLDYMNLDGGFKAISYSGIPFVADRFVADKTMYLLNSSDFKFHQLCDWRWLEGESGTVLHQVADKPVYTATLVKYADLLCERPMGQAKLTFSDLSPAPTYVVSFDSNGGTQIASQIVEAGGAPTKPVNPVKDGLTFVNWYYNGESYNFMYGQVNSDITLTAVWSEM
ncbi:MAG TPA: phage major capsid protein [Clostridia bacterium]|nr:phage major capsid protein [Clostridia bacterium]